MCGIAGFSWRDDALTRRMADAMCHRGPDASGCYVAADGRVSLVHTRLSIVDLHERSNQPLHYEHAGRKYVLAFNGEIYNYQALRRDLEQAGCAFHTETDSEVIVAAYAVWGEHCVRRMNGMWAFAILDEHNGELFLSRDRFGKKPLYYHFSSERFMFASEIKALLAGPLPRVADQASVSDFLNFGLAGHTERTFFNQISQLPAGSNGRFDARAHRWRIDPYYTLPSTVRAVETREIHDALRAAVERRLIADVPICLSLSGGLDSSAIAAMIAELHHDRMVAFTTTSADGVGDETDNVLKLVSRYPQFELVRVPLVSRDLHDDLTRMVRHLEEPFAYDSPYGRWKIAEAIHREGFKVSITGEGADELLGGYQVASHWFLATLWRRRQYARFGVEAIASLLQPDAAIIVNQLRHWFRHDKEQRTRDYYHSQSRHVGCLLPHSADGAELVSKDATLKERLHTQVSRFFLPFLLTCNDKMYMAHSVEARAPFLDVDVAELLLQIATEQLIVRGIRKYPLRHAMRGRVPDAILFDRRKIGFASPLAIRLSSPESKAWIRSLLSEPRTAPFIDPQRLRYNFDAVATGQELSVFLLHALTLELWMRQFDVSAA